MITAASYKAVADWNIDRAIVCRQTLKREKNHDKRAALSRDLHRYEDNAALCQTKAEIIRRYGGKYFG